tara:strand:+ start:779 stop:1990 length:1212 start_codon:yes stop_codon:yes gene_type:complete
MANTIQIKRSSANAAATGLAKGELAWVDHGTGGAAGILYIGDMSASSAVRKIGGPGWGLELLNNTALTGNPTAPTQAQNNNTTRLANTAYVDRQVLACTAPISQASDTTISGPAAGHVLIYDGTNSWDNKPLSGDVTIDAAGAVVVTGVAANAVALGVDTTGNYISTVTGTANEIEITNGSGSEGAAVIVGLPNNVTVTGNLTVNGTTTTVDSDVVTITDPVFSIGQNASDDNKDRGMEFKYNDGASRLGFFGYDDSTGEFTGFTAATASSETYSGTRINANFGNIAGTLTTASQTAITGVGTITTGTWTGTTVGTQYGGTGQNFSASTGVMSFNSGTASVASELPVTLGGTGIQTVAVNGLLIGAGTGDMTVLTLGGAGTILSVNAAGNGIEWNAVISGGTF